MAVDDLHYNQRNAAQGLDGRNASAAQLEFAPSDGATLELGTSAR